MVLSLVSRVLLAMPVAEVGGVWTALGRVGDKKKGFRSLGGRIVEDYVIYGRRLKIRTPKLNDGFVTRSLTRVGWD